jgi:hypothetical protein
MKARARILRKKIEIVGLLPFPVVISKNSPYIAKITDTAVFVYSPLYKSLPVPVPIEK